MNSSWDPRAWNALDVYLRRHFERTGNVHRQLPTWELLFTVLRGDHVHLGTVSGASGRDVVGRLPPQGGQPAPPATAGGRRDSSRTVPAAGLPPCAEREEEALPKAPAERFISDSLEHAQEPPLLPLPGLRDLPASPAVAVPPLAPPLAASQPEDAPPAPPATAPPAQPVMAPTAAAPPPPAAAAGNVEAATAEPPPPPPIQGNAEDGDQAAEPPRPPPVAPPSAAAAAAPVISPPPPPAAAEPAPGTERDRGGSSLRAPAASSSDCRGACVQPGPHPEFFGRSRGCLCGRSWDRGRGRQPVPHRGAVARQLFAGLFQNQEGPPGMLKSSISREWIFS
ncbi:uncharacterized protein LOC132328729 [Haemorhous mexicanus]|uniref:uncharacterized protein LOC132328729 n=1 Tax=Haemorhous mexicanus TaxID=30427 RepID=UPI0028BD24C1|nr:uncharacterized protein LOC132328729 [Haemorhous mexicanus]